MNKNSSGDTAASGCIKAVFNSYIVVSYNVFNRNTVRLCHFGCHFKVHDIAGIVFYNHQYTFIGCNCFNTFINLIRSWRSKYRACNCTIEHSLAYIAAMSRLMTASAAAYKSNFIFFFLCPYNNITAIQFFNISRISFYHSEYHFLFYIVHTVN